MNAIRFYRKVATIKSVVNKMIRQPQRVTIEKLSSGVVIETYKFKNKTIIKVV